MDWLSKLLGGQAGVFNVERPEKTQDTMLRPFGENGIEVGSIDKPYYKERAPLPSKLNSLIPENLNKPYSLYRTPDGRPFLENDQAAPGDPRIELPFNLSPRIDQPYTDFDPELRVTTAMPYRSMRRTGYSEGRI